MSDDTTEPMAYVAKAPCGCTKYAGVDAPNRAKDNAREMRWAMQQGYTIERVTCAWVRANWRYDCDVCRKPERKRGRHYAPQQEVMEL